MSGALDDKKQTSLKVGRGLVEQFRLYQRQE